MSRIRRLSFATTVILLGAAACRHAQPVVTAKPALNADSVAAAQRAEAARRDSIARADAARRDAMARADAARRDSIARAEAARRAEAEAADARATITAKIYFDYDKSDLRPEAVSALDAKARVLQARSDVHIRIEGNTDERGSDEYNLALGQRRSAAAKRYLVDRGIADARIDVVSFGEERPVCRESVESCWLQNRRDEFQITAGSIVATTGTSRQQ